MLSREAKDWKVRFLLSLFHAEVVANHPSIESRPLRRPGPEQVPLAR